MLPVGLLTQLVRLGDDALGEFFGRYVTAALDAYLQARRGVQSLASATPLGGLPLAAGDALARLLMATPFGQGFAQGYGFASPGPPPPATSPRPPAHAGEPPSDADVDPTGTEVAALRRELEELKRAVGGGRRRRR
jgi:hypothetical protein